MSDLITKYNHLTNRYEKLTKVSRKLKSQIDDVCKDVNRRCVSEMKRNISELQSDITNFVFPEMDRCQCSIISDNEIKIIVYMESDYKIRTKFYRYMKEGMFKVELDFYHTYTIDLKDLEMFTDTVEEFITNCNNSVGLKQ